MRRVRLNAVIFLLILAGVALLKVRFTNSVARAPAAVMAVSDSPLTPLLEVPQPPAVAKAEVASKIDPPKGPFAKELELYSLLHRKVFLSEGEQSEKADLLKNASLLRAMGERLKKAALEPRAFFEQNDAITMVLEALRTGDSEVASEVLGDVVADKQVESTVLDRSSRESLAGVKAQVLFMWSALKPSEASAIARMLPGPVSQRIWNNVIDAQQANLAQSADLSE